MKELYIWVISMAGLVAGLITVYFKGRNSGKKEEEAKQVEHDLIGERKRNENLRTSVDINSDVSGISDDDVRRRLRERFSRDNDKRDLRLGEADLDK